MVRVFCSKRLFQTVQTQKSLVVTSAMKSTGAVLLVLIVPDEVMICLVVSLIDIFP